MTTLKPLETPKQLATTSLNSSANTDSSAGFARRHIGPSTADVAAMLETVGAPSLAELIAQTVPASILAPGQLTFGPALTEPETAAHLRAVAAKNKVLTSLIGQGYYNTHTPAVIQRNILENPAWYTAYTPYQPEISQGRLEALINFQTMITDLTGLDIANASLLDEATAAAEAMAMAKRGANSQSTVFFVDQNCHPQTIAVLRTRATPLGWQLQIGDPVSDLKPEAVFGAILQYPGTYGHIPDYRGSIAALHAAGAIAVMATDPLALTLLASPGELGADLAIGSTQRFGVPLGFGGPHAAFLATKDSFKRNLPGRLVGVSIDARGNQAYRLALQTREQHIRREKATSNICTAQVLLAVMAGMYAVYHGPEGLKAIASRVHTLTAKLAAGLKTLGLQVEPETFFDTFTVVINSTVETEVIHKRAVAAGINLRHIPATASHPNRVGISLDETSTPQLVERLWSCFGGTLSYDEVSAEETIPCELRRTTPYLQHPVFNQYHSETEMLRYMRRLSDRDLALDRAMIPLGSCTMKLNATTEMLAISWPEFAAIHPFVPADQAQGYAAMIAALEVRLCEITGYDAFSFQPNSGAQGEYAGLLAINAYHASRSQAHRRICLIPTSAHGTNPASAQMASMEVVGVRCDQNGNVDVDDLREKAAKYADILSCVMITYPSTHGVFEEEIREICEIVHAAGGQVYLDGANLNAQVGLVYPGKFGADVSHLNLHKTFCIPHGGGGPGVGPIGVRAHLAPFLPGHPELSDGSPVGPVSAAPYGSASILAISYAYLLLMGGDGLTRATETAILNANYIAQRLDPHFPVLYKNHNGRVAHECILDPRALKNATGVSVDDLAKRLIDYGFHAPTMSFPVAGTLMVEPTESESKAEIDRFCDAMIAIRQEIAAIERGEHKVEDSPLRYAPHTVHDIAVSDAEWNRPYSRAMGCFPPTSRRTDKYWSPVNRIDNAYGDRNLFCSCPPTAEYCEAVAQ
jgi:glycine dehydrogenase